MSRRRVAFFSPLPPAKTGTADYAQELIPELKMLTDLHVFEKVPHRFDPAEFDAVVYQIGNNPHHAEIYRTALRHPGIVVMHDANLHDLIRGMTSHDPNLYLREVAYEIFGHELETLPATGLDLTGQQPPAFSMMRRLLDRSRACIVHSACTESAVRRKGFRGKVARIPHGVRPRVCDGLAARERIGVKNSAPMVGMFGYFRPDKQACECLRVFRMLLEDVPEARMVIAGQPHPEVPLKEQIRELGLESRVRLLEFQPLEDLDGYIAACDVVLNLRWPSLGESSGIAARAFGMGKTVVVSDAGADRELPDDICVRIPWDRYRDRVLLETLKWLLADRSITTGIGLSAARWVSDCCTWAHAAAKYADFLGYYSAPDESVSLTERISDHTQVSGYLARWVEPGTTNASYLDEHEERLIRTLQLTPAGAGGDRILEMGCYLQITPALRDLLGYSEIRGSYLGSGGCDRRIVNSRDGDCFECSIDLFDCERVPFPYPNGYFATVLCCELVEHLKSDPMWMMCEIHRVLKPGGVLVLTTPNIVSLRSVVSILKGNHPSFYNCYPDPRAGSGSNPKHEREYTPVEISRLLAAAGFVVDHIETGPYGRKTLPEAEWAANLLRTASESTALRGDCIFAIGRKESLPRDFRPAWLYDCAV